MYGLDPRDKSNRVYHYHRKTLKAAAGIAGIMGYDSISSVTPNDIMRRTTANEVRTLAEAFPEVERGSLLDNTAPPRLQATWDQCSSTTSTSNHSTRAKQWIY